MECRLPLARVLIALLEGNRTTEKASPSRPSTRAERRTPLRCVPFARHTAAMPLKTKQEMFFRRAKFMTKTKTRRRRRGEGAWWRGGPRGPNADAAPPATLGPSAPRLVRALGRSHPSCVTSRPCGLGCARAGRTDAEGRLTNASGRRLTGKTLYLACAKNPTVDTPCVRDSQYFPCGQSLVHGV